MKSDERAPIRLAYPVMIDGIRIIPSWWTWEMWKADILQEYRLREEEKHTNQRQWRREMHGDWR